MTSCLTVKRSLDVSIEIPFDRRISAPIMGMLLAVSQTMKFAFIFPGSKFNSSGTISSTICGSEDAWKPKIRIESSIFTTGAPFKRAGGKQLQSAPVSIITVTMWLLMEHEA